MDATEFNRDYSKQKTFYFAFLSDLHIDSNTAKLSHMIDDLEFYKKIGASVMINGDVVDLIIKQDRKRHTQGNDQFHCDAQLNAITELAINTLSPYADNIDLIGVGNHEESILKYHGYDITREIIKGLNSVKTNGNIVQGGYQGLTRFKFSHGNNNSTRSFTVYRHHGNGGQAPVTKGFISFSRVLSSVSADVYWFGHKHTAPIDPDHRMLYMDKAGNLKIKTLILFYTAGYQGKIIQDDYSKSGHRLSYGDTFVGQQSSDSKYLKIEFVGNKMRKTICKRGELE